MNIDANKVITKLQNRLSEANLQIALLQVQVEDLAAELNEKAKDAPAPPEQLELDIENE